MITNLKFKNCFAFNEQVELSLEADMRTKKFFCNIIQEQNNNILKSAVLYGPNNTGKTSLINCVKAIKDTLLNKKISLKSNLFTKNAISEESISFIYNKSKYTFEYKFDCKNNLYIYEKMIEVLKDKYGNEKEQLIYLKDTISKKYQCPSDKSLEKILDVSSNNNILIYTVQIEKFKILQEIKEILTTIAEKIEIVDMNYIPNEKTIEILKNKNDETRKIVEFIKNADIYLEDYYYEDEIGKDVDIKDADAIILKKHNLLDQIRLVSVYKGKAVPSAIFDSLGTKKIVALAGYVLEALEKGKTILIDELDSSLHFKITRAIISMFNNELNRNAQLIAILHDISLLDCKKMFRKDQIWFTDKDDKETLLYSLKEFNYADSKIRGDTVNLQDRYSKGAFGAIPEPDLITTLMEVEKDEDT